VRKPSPELEADRTKINHRRGNVTLCCHFYEADKIKSDFKEEAEKVINTNRLLKFKSDHENQIDIKTCDDGLKEERANFVILYIWLSVVTLFCIVHQHE
jgi:hypothetical protein